MSVLEATPVQLSVPPVDEVQDLHGDPVHHDLALFFHGNQWMVLDPLLREFQALHPGVTHPYYETLPPGILVQQMRQGALRVGELVLRVAPDVLTAETSVLAGLAEAEWLQEYHEYAANTLAFLVQSGNPHQVRGWPDLLLEDVRVVLPNPESEGIGRMVRDIITELLGPDAWTELAHRKAERGLTLFTQVHHRETPLQLLAGAMDVGPVWLTEALYQRRIGMPLDAVRLPADQNRRGRYGVAVVTRTTTHPEAAQAFAGFLLGPAAQAIYADYGFEGAGQAGAAAQQRLQEP